MSWNHFQGHQDGKTTMVITRDAWLNIKADTLAQAATGILWNVPTWNHQWLTKDGLQSFVALCPWEKHAALALPVHSSLPTMQLVDGRQSPYSIMQWCR